MKCSKANLGAQVLEKKVLSVITGSEISYMVKKIKAVYVLTVETVGAEMKFVIRLHLMKSSRCAFLIELE